MLKSNIFTKLKSILFLAIIIFTTTFLQFYWSMGQFAKHTSSSCLSCSFLDDAFMVAILSTICLTIVFQLLSAIKNKLVKIHIELLLLIVVWLYWNYSVFVERESSWSTYLFSEEILSTISISLLPVGLLSLITIAIINNKFLKEKIGIKFKALPTILFFAFALQSCSNEKQATSENKGTKKINKVAKNNSVPTDKTTKNPNDFIPNGYVIHQAKEGIFSEGWDEIKGDLNKDGLEDVVLIIKGTDQTKIIKDETRGTLDRNRRGIIVLLNKGNHYELAAKNYTCFSSENEDGGVYFAPELSVNINKGILNISYGHGRYGSWGYTFRYQNKNVELIGYDAYNSRGPVPQYEVSINFLTKKKLTRDNLNKDDDGDNYEVKYKDTWENIKFKKPIKLSEIKDFDGLSF